MGREVNSARDKNTHKRNWINSIRSDGFRPELLILDEVPLDKWQWWETFYISLYQTYGFKLVNYTNGGDGSTFGNDGSFKKGSVRFESITEAGEATGINLKYISACCRGKNKTSGGFIWKFDKIIIK